MELGCIYSKTPPYFYSLLKYYLKVLKLYNLYFWKYILGEEIVLIKRIVLDVLVPNKISIIEFAEKLASMKGIDAVNITVKEIDAETETLIVVIEGNNIDFNSVSELIEKMGGVIHSIDQVIAGNRITNIPREVFSETS